jgi:hypothetical protein
LLSLIRLGGRRMDGGSMGVEGKQQAHLIAIEFWFQPPERLYGDEERPFHRTVVSPESNGVSSRIINSALVREIEHLSADLCCDDEKQVFRTMIDRSQLNSLIEHRFMVPGIYFAPGTGFSSQEA